MRDGQEEIRTTVPAEESQETTGHPGGQPKIPKPKRHKETTQQNERTERRLLFLIAAGTVCQTGSHSWYSWCVAMLAMLATGAQAQDPGRMRDISGIPAEEIIVAREAPSFETSEPRGTSIQGPTQGYMTGRRRKQPTKLGNRPWCEEATQ